MAKKKANADDTSQPPIDLDAPQKNFLLNLDIWQREGFPELIKSLRNKYPDLKYPPEAERYLLSLKENPDAFRKVYETMMLELATGGHNSRMGHTKRDSHKDKIKFQKMIRPFLNQIETINDLNDIPGDSTDTPRDFLVWYTNSTIRGWINELQPGLLKRGNPSNRSK